MADTKAEKAEKAEAKADAAAAKKAAADKPAGVAAGSPGDPTDHSVSAGALAAQVDPAKKSGAAVNAESMDKISAKADAKEKAEAAEEDNTIVGKLKRSGLYFVRNHSTGEDYIGESPQNDPDASDASKLRSTVMPISVHPPRTGMQVRIKGGESFTVGEGFGPDAVPADWQKVTKPDGSLLFA